MKAVNSKHPGECFLCTASSPVHVMWCNLRTWGLSVFDWNIFQPHRALWNFRAQALWAHLWWNAMSHSICNNLCTNLLLLVTIHVSYVKEYIYTQTHTLTYTTTHLVDPGGHCVLCVIRCFHLRIAGWILTNAGHHLLHAHRLHCVRHHQSVDHCQVSALEEEQVQRKISRVKTSSFEVAGHTSGLL